MKPNEELFEVLNEQFPKGECKERGNALVLFAEAENQILKAKSSAIKEVLEIIEQRIKHKEDTMKLCELDLNEICFTCQMRMAQCNELQNLKATLQEKTA